MAPHLFTRPQFEYAETHLRILSGFYGVLRPFDGVLPLPAGDGGQMQHPLLQKPLRLLGRFPVPDADRRRGGHPAQPGLGGVRQSGTPLGNPSRAVDRRDLRRDGRRQGGGEGGLCQDGPGGDGTLPGGAERRNAGGGPGLRPAGLPFPPRPLHRRLLRILREGRAN